MANSIEYALMAGDSYISSRHKNNQFPVPQGWAKINNPAPYFNDSDSGFEAISFQKGNEIVISFAGTYNKSAADIEADIVLGAGGMSNQLFQAAEYYMQVRLDNPNARITLTGHSLGGGLASLIAVFFNETAVTFDQAPFRNTASAARASELVTDLVAKFPVSTYPQVTQWLDPLNKFVSSYDPLGLGWSANGLAAREAKVTSTSMQGEFLSALSALRIGKETPSLTHGFCADPENSRHLRPTDTPELFHSRWQVQSQWR